MSGTTTGKHTAEEIAAAVEFLNARHVHINTRGGDGIKRPLTGDTIVAVAEVVRAFERATGDAA